MLKKSLKTLERKPPEYETGERLELNGALVHHYVRHNIKTALGPIESG